jgi:hypothetical protein
MVLASPAATAMATASDATVAVTADAWRQPCTPASKHDLPGTGRISKPKRPLALAGEMSPLLDQATRPPTEERGGVVSLEWASIPEYTPTITPSATEL